MRFAATLALLLLAACGGGGGAPEAIEQLERDWVGGVVTWSDEHQSFVYYPKTQYALDADGWRITASEAVRWRHDQETIESSYRLMLEEWHRCENGDPNCDFIAWFDWPTEDLATNWPALDSRYPGELLVFDPNRLVPVTRRELEWGWLP